MVKNLDFEREKSLSGSAGIGALQSLIARAADGTRGLPPVDKWNPPFCGDIDMEIRSDGTWFYMGTPIGRAPLVRLFSTVLRKDEDGKTYLVTPVEKVGIRIVDAPFVAVELVQEAGLLTFRTNVGDVVSAGAEHPIRFEIEPVTGGLKPYIHIRGRLEALFSRALMYELVALGEDMAIDGQSWFAVRSGGQVFKIMPSAQLAELSL